MITKLRSWTYSQKMVRLLSIRQIMQTLLLEIYKIKHNLCESYLKDPFSAVNGNYNIRFQSDFRVPGINTVFYGVNLIRYFVSGI